MRPANRKIFLGQRRRVPPATLKKLWGRVPLNATGDPNNAFGVKQKHGVGDECYGYGDGLHQLEFKPLIS